LAIRAKDLAKGLRPFKSPRAQPLMEFEALRDLELETGNSELGTEFSKLFRYTIF